MTVDRDKVFDFLSVIIACFLLGLATVYFYGAGWLTYALILAGVLLVLFLLFECAPGRVNLVIFMFFTFIFLLMHFFSCLEGESFLSWSRSVHFLSVFAFLYFSSRLAVGKAESRGLVFFMTAAILFIPLLNYQSLHISELQIFIIQFVFVSVSFLFLRDAACDSLPFFAFVFFVFFVMLFSNCMASAVDGVRASGLRVLYMLGHFMFAFSVYGVLRTFRWDIFLFFPPVCLSLLVCLFSVLSLWFSLEFPRDYNWVGESPLFGNIRHMGYFLCFSTVFFVCSLFWFRVNLFFSFLMCFLSFSLLFWNGGRGAVLSVFIGSALVAFFAGFPFSRIFVFLVAVLASLLASALFYVNSPGVGWLNWIVRVKGADSMDALSSGRLEIWSYMIPYIKERIWLGWGGDGFASVWRSSNLVQAHNGFFQLLIEWGGLVACAITIFIGVLLLKGIKAVPLARGEAKTYLVVGLSVSVSMLTLSMFDGVFYYGAPGTSLALGLALLSAGVSISRLERCSDFSAKS